MADGKGKNNKGLKIFLIVSVSVLIVALGVAGVLVFGSKDASNIERILDYGTIANGVSVGGIDISGMTKEEAREATKALAADLMDATQLQFDVGGVVTALDAETIGLTTDYEDIIAQASEFSRSGDFKKRSEELADIKDGGKDFKVSISADEASVKAALVSLGEPFNVEAKDATYTFMPDGYFEDGTPYTIPTDSYGKGTEEVSGLVRIPDTEMPNKFRYQYWQNKKYIENYIPKDANISRFLYTPEQRGTKTDVDELAALILEAVQNGDLTSVISTPTQVTEPTVTLEQIKAQTQLVASWTSSYSNHDGSNRVYNVAKMCDIVGGIILQPGVEWSVNEEAGPRKTSTGWKEAAGINGGAFVPDPGGGVCQISSTLYNAAIRSGIEVTDYKHHSIISDYIPIGLDATISTGGPDLKLKNNNPTPMFIVSYINYKEKNVTVEIYGTPVVDPTYGDVILTFTSERGGTGAKPETTIVYNATVTPDGTRIPVGKSVTYREARGSTSATSYKHILDLNGKELHTEVYEKSSYRSYTGLVYANYADPSIPVVTPTPPPTDPSGPPDQPPTETPEQPATSPTA